jgi:hypothetical protein
MCVGCVMSRLCRGCNAASAQTRLKVAKMQHDNPTIPPIAAKSRRHRSAVSAGNRQFVALGDGRSAWSRRQADIVDQLVEDAGGIELVGAAKFALCQAAAVLQIELESMAAIRSAGGPLDVDVFGRALGNLRRALETLGVERVKRDVTPDFRTYVAAKSKGSPA